MSLSKNPNSYLHIKPVLDIAVENGGGIYTLESHTAALKWRAQAHAYRSIIGKTGPTNYDLLILSVDDNKIIIKVAKVSGEFRNPLGDVVELSKKPPDPEDKLLDIARELAASIDGLD
jgi:hypothetical protein